MTVSFPVSDPIFTKYRPPIVKQDCLYVIGDIYSFNKQKYIHVLIVDRQANLSVFAERV